MVTFTCLRCNESLKKSAVAKHMCRKPAQLTCIDCLKDFTEVTYVEHTQCMTEDERYGGAGYVAKPVAKKQTSWIDVIKNCSEKSNLTVIQKKILDILADAPNVPRKLAAFRNFCQSNRLLRTYNQYLIEDVFNVLTQEWKDSQTNNSDESKSPEKQKDQSQKGNLEPTTEMEVSEQNESSEKKKKKKKDKRKNKESGDEPASVNGDHNISLNGNEKSLDTSTLDCSNTQMEEEKTEEKPVSALPDMSHLSKKERKKLLKQMKYEAELKEIEATPMEASVENGDGEEGTKEKVKEKKKSKKRKANDADNAAPLENNHETTEIKKQKLNENENTSPPLAQETSGKFDWQDVITRVLQASSDNELPLKRLYKKVINEYFSQCGEREDYEKLLSKCSKKVQKTPGIRVLKDRAKLVPIN